MTFDPSKEGAIELFDPANEGAVAIADPNFNQVESEDRAGELWDFAVDTKLPANALRTVYSYLKEEGQVENFTNTYNEVVTGKRAKNLPPPRFPGGTPRDIRVSRGRGAQREAEQPVLMTRIVKSFGRSFVNLLAEINTQSNVGKISTGLTVLAERMRMAKDAGLMPEDGGIKSFLAIDYKIRDELFGGETMEEHAVRVEAETFAATPGMKATALPEALDFPEKAADAVGKISAFVSKLAITKKVLGIPARGETVFEGLVAWEMLNQAEGGPSGAGAAMYIALRGIDKIPVEGAKGFFVKTGSQSAVFAGTAAVAGADKETIVMAALLPWALRGFDAAVKTGIKINRTQLEAKAVKNLRDIGSANGIDLRQVPDSALKFLVGKTRQARFWNKQFDKGKISAETHDMRLNQIRQEVAPLLSAIAKQQPITPAGVAIVKAEPTAKKAAPGAKPPTEAKGAGKRVLFHGGPVEKGKLPTAEKADLTDIRGVFFTEDAETAKFFGEREGREGIVQEFEVDIKNSATGEIAAQIEAELRAEGVKEPQLFQSVTDELLDRGFDSVIRESGVGDEIIVLKDEAITHPPTAPKPPVDQKAKMQKLMDRAIKDIGKAKQPRRLIEKEKTAELGKRAGRSAKAAADAAGEQRLNAALGQLKGPLTDYKRPDFTPLKETWSQADIDAAHDDIWVRPHSPDHFDQLSTAEAWSKVTEGFVPTRGEILLLEKQWGKGIVRALLKKRPFGDRAWDAGADVSNFMITMIAGGDASVAGRQLRVLGQAYPLEWGTAVKKGLGAYRSEKLAVLMRQEYTASDFHKEAKQYVQFFDPAGTVTTPPSERPEWYVSHYPEQVPIVGHLIKMGNRNYVETMNMFTQSVWDKLRAQDLRNGIEPTEDQLNLRGKWLMSMTGRPEIGGFVGRRLSPIVSGFFFAPRFAVSRFTSPTYLRYLASGDPVAREVGRNTAIAFSSFIGTNLAIISLLKLAYGDKVEVEINPLSPDWGKVKIGNTRIDLWAGHQQAARFLVQMALGAYKTQSGKIKETSRLEITGRFIRGKENPLVSLISDLYEGKTYEGDRPFSPPEGEMGRILDELQIPELIQGIGKEAYRRMLFMWAQDFLEATDNDGWLLGFTAGTLSFFGFNTSSYEDTAFTKIAKFKDAIAQTEHGRDWHDLNSSQQSRLSRVNKQVFAEMELQANIEGARRDDYDYVGRLIEDEKKAGKKVYKKLSPTSRKLLDEAGISLGLSRKIGDWEINDERYEQYQKMTAELLEVKLSKLANITGWANLPNSRKIIKIELAVQIAKDKAKSQVRREAKRLP